MITQLTPRVRACLSPSQEPSSIEKVAEIDEHMGCAMSGLTADAKTLIDHARAETQVRASCRRRWRWRSTARWRHVVLSCTSLLGGVDVQYRCGLGTGTGVRSAPLAPAC